MAYYVIVEKNADGKVTAARSVEQAIAPEPGEGQTVIPADSGYHARSIRDDVIMEAMADGS